MAKSKSRKKGWKKIPRDVDEQMEGVHVQKRVSQAIDEELFFEDPNPMEEREAALKDLTHRQKAALKYRRERAERLQELALKSDEKMDCDFIQNSPIDNKSWNLLNVESENKLIRTNKPKSSKQPYDLWDEANELPLKMKMRKTKKYVPSVLPAVVVPHEGASYNPPLDSYLEYANKVAKEEAKLEAKEKRMDRCFELVEKEIGMKPALREELHVFIGGSDQKVSKRIGKRLQEQSADVEDESEGGAIALRPKPKTKKQKKRAVQSKLESQEFAEKKIRRHKEHQLSNLKALTRQVKRDIASHSLSVASRRAERALRRLTERKRLGRGKFEPYPEPVLLSSELTATLRQLKPQGDIFQERLSSFQQRNLVPIAGQKQPNLVKTKLRVKRVEKRSVKMVTEKSRVI